MLVHVLSGVIGLVPCAFAQPGAQPVYDRFTFDDLLRKVDASRDGIVTRQELDAVQPQWLTRDLHARYVSDFADANGDGRIDRLEFTELMQGRDSEPTSVKQEL